MNLDAMATRLSVLTRALPLRILIVDDDELELALMADRLATSGFEVTRAADGAQALELATRQWFPVVITDWQMPVMDGIALTEQLRDRGMLDTYIIMLTARGANLDYERGYVAGVDDYITKRVPDAEFFARIHAAFNTLALRRSLQETQSALAMAGTAPSGAVSVPETHSRLLSEIRRAQRYGRNLALLSIGAHLAATPQQPLTLAQQRALYDGMKGLVRAHVDWIGTVATGTGAAFAVVLPEAGVTEAPIVKERLANALRHFADSGELILSYGVTALGREGEGPPVDVDDMLAVVEHCRGCGGRSGAAQLATVQRSVSAHTAIVCRRGYSVDSSCTLKNQDSPSGTPLVAAG